MNKQAKAYHTIQYLIGMLKSVNQFSESSIRYSIHRYEN